MQFVFLLIIFYSICSFVHYWRVDIAKKYVFQVKVQGDAIHPDSLYPIPDTLTHAARVSLLLTDEKGQVVREMLHAAPRTKSAHTEIWDGLNDEGKPIQMTFAQSFLQIQNGR